MEVVSTCPLRVASLIWQPRPGAWVLTVVCKATLFLRPGECALAPSQVAPADDDRHVDDDPARSLRVPRDLVPVKPSVDVLVVGSAFAPEKRPVRSLVARLSVGDVDKSVEVVADRAVRPDGAVREGQPFVQMSLAYEGAAFGPSNPVGVRRDARDAAGFGRAPSLRRPGASADGPLEPVGLGPIAPSWPERGERLTGAAAGWSFRDLGQRPLPEGMDLGFFNAAPRDQQLRALDERPRIALEHLHPDHATLVTTLPALAPRAVLEGRRAGPQPIALRADTLLIDTERGLCFVTYRGMVPLEGAAETGRVVVSMEGYKAADGDPSGVFRAPPRYDMTADLPPDVRLGAALPFAFTPLPPPAPLTPPAPSAPAPQPVASPWAAGSPLSAAPSPTVALPAIVPTAPPVPAMPQSAPAAAASDAAAGVVGRILRSEPSPARAQAAPELAPLPARPLQSQPAEIVELVWFDPEAVPRVRRKASWRPLLDALEHAPPHPDFDDPAFAKDPTLIEDRRELFEILARAEPCLAQGLEETFARCMLDDGKFIPTLAVFAGELELPFDELAALRATLTTVGPLAGQDDALKIAVQAAKDFLATPGLMSAPAVAEALTKRMEDAFAQGKRVVPAGYLEAQRERALLEQRQYQRRAVFGSKHLRGLLELGGGEPQATPQKGKPAPAGAPTIVPAYLPESLAEALPMYPRFRARVLAEVRLSADRYETHPAALRVLGLCRVAAPSKA